MAARSASRFLACIARYSSRKPWTMCSGISDTGSMTGGRSWGPDGALSPCGCSWPVGGREPPVRGREPLVGGREQPVGGREPLAEGGGSPLLRAMRLRNSASRDSASEACDAMDSAAVLGRYALASRSED